MKKNKIREQKIHSQIFAFLVTVLMAIIIFRNESDTKLNNAYVSRGVSIGFPIETKNNFHSEIVEANPNGVENISTFVQPLNRVNERVTKKYFGTYVAPKNSPVQPERFQGYHTGADFETFSEEANEEMTVYAVCSGKLLSKRYASGYGGVAVQECELNGQPITVVYGHLKLASIRNYIGEMLNAGDALGNLGQGYSVETNGERKHLHLGFHKGASINILGYVNSKEALSGWIDPCQYVCGK